jgi:hypothetical protein
MPPELVIDTLLVVEPFRSGEVDYRAGDRVPTRHRAIRRIAAAHPEWFRMEYATAELDLKWFASLEAGFEEKYQAAKRARDGQEERRERALRQEMKEQDAPQPELERRFKHQEEERKRHEQEAREEREREALESRIEFAGDLTSGFNF